MPLQFAECFGHGLESEGLQRAFEEKLCPFVGGTCHKKVKGSFISGACSLSLGLSSNAVICCPKRLYAEDYRILRDIAANAFGEDVPMVFEGDPVPDSSFAMPFGQKQGKEIRIPFRLGGKGTKYSVDWVIALISKDRELLEFVAVEVQTIDTTGNYHAAFFEIARKIEPQLLEGIVPTTNLSGNFNDENVNKRILPQLITKGHVLRRERLCKKGLYFVCPTRVFDNIFDRVGVLPGYPPQTGAITFIGYDIEVSAGGSMAKLVKSKSLTSTTEQLSVAFASAQNLPEEGVYESAIRAAVSERFE